MKKLSDRLQALIADGEIPLSDAWGKLIDDLKATEQQKPVYIDKEGYEAITDILDRRISGAGRYVSLSRHSGEPIEKRYPIYLFQQMPAENNDREMLKRLAVILSGSDAPGEIRSLTVTAQSFVDRCKTLAKERDALQLAGGQPQRDMPLSARANGEANSYTLLMDGNWFANILMNGEMTVPQQWDFINTIAKKQ